MVSFDTTSHLCAQPVMGNQASRKSSSSSISQSHVNIDPYTTPPGTPSDDEQSPLPPMTMSPRPRRPKCLRTAVFWELTDCRHYPPSPGTGLTLISPVPYPYKPSPLPASFYGDDDNEDIEDIDQIMTFDGTASPHDPMIIDTNTLAHISADMKEALRESRNENGYPITSSPSTRKLLRKVSALSSSPNQSSPPNPPPAALPTSPNLSPVNPSPQDLEVSTHLSHHLSALDIHSDIRPHYSQSAAHLARKARIENMKTIQRSAVYKPRERFKDKMEANMWQLNKWADGDEEKKATVARILHGRGEERTEGMVDPF
ncbi:hypothetical protein D6C89_05709 [Aureobasidium pullulans]|nr:hypothetical protein D6D03_05718 [Aureobasidium pullulans]THZ23089.1 hypothetical protein D6C89_05709 [Aureobasidium pullulans]